MRYDKIYKVEIKYKHHSEIKRYAFRMNAIKEYLKQSSNKDVEWVYFLNTKNCCDSLRHNGGY